MKKFYFVMCLFGALLWGNCLVVQGAEEVFPELSLEMKGDYECSPGDILDFSVVISNETKGVDGKNIVVQSLPIPEGMTLLGNAGNNNDLQFQLDQEKNKWKVTCEKLEYGRPLVVAYQCKVEQECNAGELLMEVIGSSKSLPYEISDAWDIWVNEPDIQKEVQVKPRKWKKGESVTCQILLKNKQKDTIGKEIKVDEGLLPEELVLEGEDAIDILGIQEEIIYPKADQKLGLTGDTVKNRYDIQQQEGEFLVEMEYLPWDGPVIISVNCVATEDGQWKKQPEKPAVLMAKQQVVNPNLMKNDGRQSNEFRVGEEVLYEVTVSNGNPLTTTENVYVTLEVPEGMTLSKGSRRTHEISKLDFGELETIQYSCVIGEDANGREIENQIKVRSNNGQEVMTSSRIWVNSPSFQIVLEEQKSQIEKGEELEHTLVITQEQKGCVAKDVILQVSYESSGISVARGTVQLKDGLGNDLNGIIQEVGEGFFLASEATLSDGAQGRIILTHNSILEDVVTSNGQVRYIVTVNSRENCPKEFQRVLF